MFRAQLSQFFPPKAAFTEADVAPQHGRIFIVTGGASGIGLEVAKVLYQKGGRVYIAGRSEEKARKAMHEIQAAAPPSGSPGSLEFLHLDLADLASIKASAESFKAKESRLDVLFNNAGVSQPPLGSVSKQGIELQLATNCLGPFLFTQLLLPLLESTAALCASSGSSGSVRVIWTSSQMMELSAPQGTIPMSEVRDPPKDVTRNYVNSKTGNYLLSTELARQQSQKGQPVVSVALNPGAAKTQLFRHRPWMKYVAGPLLYPAKMAALTQLYAGLSGDIGAENNGCYVVPWGRVATFLRKDLVDAAKGEEEGGTGRAQEFWAFCDETVKEYY